jgi:bifunctional non-homologous end joining protein LigD
VLFVGGKDIRNKPLLERKTVLQAPLPRDALLHYSEHVAEFGKRAFAKAQRANEEGVNAKPAASLYHSGKQTREWLEFKTVLEQEVMIVGHTGPRRSRKYFGALALAVRDKARKQWVYVGHVGTGFTVAALKSLYETMQPLRTDKKPFGQKVKHENETAWLVPKLVDEVKFTEWTSEAKRGIRLFSACAPTRGRSTSSWNGLEEAPQGNLKSKQRSTVPIASAPGGAANRNDGRAASIPGFCYH